MEGEEGNISIAYIFSRIIIIKQNIARILAISVAHQHQRLLNIMRAARLCTHRARHASFAPVKSMGAICGISAAIGKYQRQLNKGGRYQR